MNPKDSLPHLQEVATRPFPQSEQSSPCPTNSCNILIPKLQKTKLEILSEKMNETEKFYKIFVTCEGLN